MSWELYKINHIIEITFSAKNAEEAETDLVNAKAAKR